MAKKLQSIKCCICTAVIPEERIIRKGVTCSLACSKLLKARRRQREDLKYCRRCGQPCSPDERKEFQAWRRARGEKRSKAGRPPLTPGQKAVAREEREARAARRGMPVQTQFTEMINV